MKEENLPLNTPAAQALLGARDVIAEEAFKRVVVKPDRYGIVTIAHNFIPLGDMAEDGTWVGVVPK